MLFSLILPVDSNNSKQGAIMQNLMLVIKLIPVIIELLKAIEAAIPEQGQGTAKLQAVRQILELTDSSIKEAWPMVQGVIEVLVKTFNTTGVFKK